MSSAHLKTLREVTGLTMQEAADLAAVELRTWQRWEAPDNTAPLKPDVVEMLESASDLIDSMIDNALEWLEELHEYTETEAHELPVTVARYRNQAALDAAHPDFPWPLSVYDSYTTHLLALLRSLGHRATVVWDNQTPEELSVTHYERIN